ncbi:hypothetical protein ElP_15730 [Tautonia plasticadhaerens]|uniref:Uncharacterized protein n=1 Tax=Tautonia plasticadhaerens TaxID=2527974 RepID=A0A518GYL8_9BACT|nr:hypothetical protein ElP_15730 [Tautonia plasticadhaerens]
MQAGFASFDEQGQDLAPPRWGPDLHDGRVVFRTPEDPLVAFE